MNPKILVFMCCCLCLTIGQPNSYAQEKVKSQNEYHNPHPPYPIRIVDNKVVLDAGTCVLQLVSDGTGKIVKATVVKSSGHTNLDENSVSFALKNWKGPANSTWQESTEYKPK